MVYIVGVEDSFKGLSFLVEGVVDVLATIDAGIWLLLLVLAIDLDLGLRRRLRCKHACVGSPSRP